MEIIRKIFWGKLSFLHVVVVQLEGNAYLKCKWLLIGNYTLTGLINVLKLILQLFSAKDRFNSDIWKPLIVSGLQPKQQH